MSSLPGGTSLVADLAVIMTVAAVVYFLFQWLKQPAVLGYLVAGALIGPYTPPFALVSDLSILSTTADLGVVLLLFGIGLQFPLTRLAKAGKISIGVAFVEITVMLLLSFGMGWILDWPSLDSLFLGIALASSSTAIIAKVLADYGMLNDISATIMLGVLVVEDMVVVGLLSVTSSVVAAHSISLMGIVLITLKMCSLIFITVILGIYGVPKLIDRLVKLGNNELILLTTLGLCFGFSVATNLMGFSPAMGAFLAGITVASAKSVAKVESIISPLKDMFAAIFFISVGALIDFGQFENFLIPALIVTVLMVVGKMLGCGLGTKMFGYDASVSLRVGLGMSQIGEFAFVVMKVGQELNVISPFMYPMVGVAVAITTFMTPYLIKFSYSPKTTRLLGFFRKPAGDRKNNKNPK